MKKLFFLAAVAMALASCTNEESIFESQEPQEIAFQAFATNATRGAVTTATGWEAPIYVASAYQANAAGDYSNLFSAVGDFVEFNKDAISGWLSATPYYYPSNGTIDFLAYATGDGADKVEPAATLSRESSDKGISNLRLDYTAEGHKLTGITDVMYAFNGGLASPQTANVPLEFKHTLAWLQITMSAPANTVLIKSLHVNNASLTGVLDIPVNNHAIGTPVWTPSAPEAAVPFKSFCPATPTFVGSPTLTDQGGVLVVPGDQTQLTLVYRLASNPDVDITHVINLAGTDIVWKAGLHYVYNISFDSMNKISFNCTVNDYTLVNSEAIKP